MLDTEYTRRRFTWAIVALPLGAALSGCQRTAQEPQPAPEPAPQPAQEPTPSLTKFLANADLQIETDAQRAELQRALHDIATLSVKELAEKRYADYGGRAGQWTALQILRAYFYSPAPPPASDEAFYAELDTPAVRENVRQFANSKASSLGAR